MALDPSIILGAKSPQFDLSQFSPMNAMTNIMKFKQYDQESELNALKMGEYKRARAEEEGLRNYLSGGREMPAPDLSSSDTRSTLATRFGKTGTAYAKALSEQDTAELTRKKTAFELKTAQRKFGDDLKRSLSSNPSDENIIAFGQDAVIQGLYTPEQVETTVRQLLAMPPAQRVAVLAQSGASAAELKPTLTSQNLGGTTRLVSTPAFGGPATTVGNTEQAVTMTPAQRREAEDSAKRLVLDARRLGLEDRRVAVLEANNRRDADPAFQQQMATARATGEAIAKGDVAAAQALPKIISRAEEGVRLIDELVGKRDSTTGQLLKGSKPHPGFSTTVGATLLPGSRFIPGTDAASFMSRFDQIKGASFLEAFEALKGGGAITEKEGSKATEAINRMSIATDEKEFVRAALDLQDAIRKGVTNAQAKASRSGGGRAGGGAVDTSNPLLK
jgi:hypothetical protein